MCETHENKHSIRLASNFNRVDYPFLFDYLCHIGMKGVKLKFEGLIKSSANTLLEYTINYYNHGEHYNRSRERL